MKPSSIPIVLAFCVSSVAPPLVSTSYAQSIPKSNEKKWRAIAKKLHITREQAKQLLPILELEAPKLQAIRNNPSLSGAERLQQLQAVLDRFDPQIKTILTPQQYAQVQMYIQARRALLVEAIEREARSQTQGSASRSATPPEPHQK